MAKLFVDKNEIEADEGKNLLRACLDNGIYIPNLCFLDETDSPCRESFVPASCRLCLVEIEGGDKPVTSCTAKVSDGMVIRTDTPEIRRLQKTAFELLLSDHHVDCANCPSNKNCSLQNIAKFLRVSLKSKRLELLEIEAKTEQEHPFLRYQHHKCIKCGKCIFVCSKRHGRPYLTFSNRGLEMTISFFGETDPASIPCNECYACVDICPVSGLTRKRPLKVADKSIR